MVRTTGPGTCASRSEDEVAGGLRHLLAVEADQPDVQPGPSERRHPGGRFGLRSFVGVVREPQVGAAGVQVQRWAVGRQRHRGALGVPARSSLSPGAGSGRLSRLAALPHRLVERVAIGHETEQSDPTTSNKLQDLAYSVDKNLWQLRAHIERPGGLGDDTLRQTSTATPSRRSSRSTASTQTYVAACSRRVTWLG